MTNLKHKILETVKKNNITMIPKWKFILYSSIGIAGIIFAFLVAVFTLSLILFVLSRYGLMYMSFFGFMTTLHTLGIIPPLLILFTVVLLVLIEVLARYYSFSFRRPLAVTLLFLTSVATIVSYIISESPIHEYVRGYAKDHHFDMMAKAYDRPLPFKPRADMNNPMDVIRGEVMATSATSTTLKLFDGAIVIAYASTTSGKMLMVPVVHDDIVIFGSFIGDRFVISRMRPAKRMYFGGYIRDVHERGNYAKPVEVEMRMK